MSCVTSMTTARFRLCKPRMADLDECPGGDRRPLGFAEPTGRRCQSDLHGNSLSGELCLRQARHGRAGCGRGPGEL